MDKGLLAQTLAAMRPRNVIAMTAVGEADDLGLTGMTATINTAQNRVNSGVTTFGVDLVGVLTWPWQYSTLNANNPRLPFLLKMNDNDPMYAAALILADQALAGTLEDITSGSTHYVNPKLVDPLPDWATGIPRFTCGQQLYFRVSPY